MAKANSRVVAGSSGTSTWPATFFSCTGSECGRRLETGGVWEGKADGGGLVGTTGPVPEPAYAQFHFSCFRTTVVFFRKWLIFSLPFSFMLTNRKQCSHPAEALFQKLGNAFAFCDARSIFLAPHCPGGRVEVQLPPGPSPLRGMPVGASGGAATRLPCEAVSPLGQDRTLLESKSHLVLCTLESSTCLTSVMH